MKTNYETTVVRVIGNDSRTTSAMCPLESFFWVLEDVHTGEQYLYSGEAFEKDHRECQKQVGFRFNISTRTFPVSFRFTKPLGKYRRIGYVKIHNEWR